MQEFFGARLFFIIQFFEDYKNNLFSIFKIYEGGLVYYGGLFAGIVTLFVYVRKHHLPFLKIIDILMPSAALGLGFGRIGCFLNGCCFGKVALHIPWAIQFPRTLDKTGMVDGSPAFLHQYELGLVHLSDVHTLPIHPTQLYSFLSDVALFFILSAFFQYRKRDGEVLLLFGILYPLYDSAWKHSGMIIHYSSICLPLPRLSASVCLLYQSSFLQSADLKRQERQKCVGSPAPRNTSH